MILSNRHRFVFVKTHKTGGTSVEMALSPLCGDADVLTPFNPPDEYRRLRQGGRACQNFAADERAERRFIDFVEEHEGGALDYPAELHSSRLFYNHMPIARVLELSPPEVSGFYKFTIERHPYEKAISLAHFALRIREHTFGGAIEATLEEILRELDRLWKEGALRHIRNYDLYSIDGRVAVDAVIDHRDLEEGFQAALRRLGLDARTPLPRLKVGRRDRATKPSELLSDRQRSYIRELCREEFELMGYET